MRGGLGANAPHPIAEQANDAEFVRPLAEATGVWFGGGDQVVLTEAYLGTEVERQLEGAVLARGGVIGGTSAGAAVMTRVMIAGGRTKADVGEGFDFLPGAVVDQHFLKRNRIERLLGVLSAPPEPDRPGHRRADRPGGQRPEQRLNVDRRTPTSWPASPARATTRPGSKFLKPGDEVNLADLKIPNIATAPDLVSDRSDPAPTRQGLHILINALRRERLFARPPGVFVAPSIRTRRRRSARRRWRGSRTG